MYLYNKNTLEYAQIARKNETESKIPYIEGRSSIFTFRCVCPFGYEVAADGIHCIDINECESEANTCRYDCKNLIGTFMCVCPAGFRKLDVGDECEDVNECENPDICGGGGRCINTAGAYICECTR